MFTPPLKYSLMTSSKQTQAQTIFEPEESLNICHNIGIFSPKKLTKLLSNAFSFSNSVFFYIISVCFEDIHYLGQQTVSIFVRCFIKWSIAFPKLSHKEYFFLVSSTFRFFFFFWWFVFPLEEFKKISSNWKAWINVHSKIFSLFQWCFEKCSLNIKWCQSSSETDKKKLHRINTLV